jgi:hypothetical protein
MTDGPVFVLHDESDRAYAERLAGALAPLAAFPVDLRPGGDREIQYGSGAICVLLWSPRMCSQEIADRALSALGKMRGNAAVCRLDAAPQFNGGTCETVQASNDLDAVSAEIRAVVTRLRQQLSQRGAQRGRTAPKLAHAGGSAGSAPQPRGKADGSMRSAYGLAATLAVVGIIAPTVTYRAGATNLPPTAEREGSASTSSDAPAADVAREDEQRAEFASTNSSAIQREIAPIAHERADRAPAAPEAITPVVVQGVVVADSAPTDLADQPQPRVAPAPLDVAVSVEPPAPVLEVNAKLAARYPLPDATGMLMIAPMPLVKPAEREYRALTPPMNQSLDDVSEVAKGRNVTSDAGADLTTGDD